jgi:hypothetical protein
LRKLQDGRVTITDKQIVLDCFAELVEAMLLSYAAVEALVNKRIESLDGSVRVKRTNARGIEAELGKAEMACRMSTGKKLGTAIPLVTRESSIKGTTFSGAVRPP